MFSHIIIGSITLIDPSNPFKARIRHIFFIMPPTDAFVFQKINHRGYIGRDLVKIVVVHSEILATNSGNIIRFAWMCHAAAFITGLQSELRDELDSTH